jgi:hypothetical protein
MQQGAVEVEQHGVDGQFARHDLHGLSPVISQ